MIATHTQKLKRSLIPKLGRLEGRTVVDERLVREELGENLDAVLHVAAVLADRVHLLHREHVRLIEATQARDEEHRALTVRLLVVHRVPKRVKDAEAGLEARELDDLYHAV